MIFKSDYSAGFSTGLHRDYNMMRPHENKKREHLKLPPGYQFDLMGLGAFFQGC
jgi:hypothetical protein